MVGTGDDTPDKVDATAPLLFDPTAVGLVTIIPTPVGTESIGTDEEEEEAVDDAISGGEGITVLFSITRVNIEVALTRSLRLSLMDNIRFVGETVW